MSTSPLTEVDRILQSTAQALKQAEEKTKRGDLSKEALTALTATLNASLNDQLANLQNVKMGSIKLNQDLKSRINNVLSMIAALNSRQVFETTAPLRVTLNKLERVLKNFKIGEKVEAVDQNPL